LDPAVSNVLIEDCFILQYERDRPQPFHSYYYNCVDIKYKYIGHFVLGSEAVHFSAWNLLLVLEKQQVGSIVPSLYPIVA